MKTMIMSFLTGLILFGLGTLSTFAATTVLNYSDHDPDTFLRSKGMKMFFQYIEEETEGRIKVVPFFGGALGKSEEALRMVEVGAVDMGFVYPDYFPNRLKAVSIFKTFPVGPNSYAKTIEMYQQIYATIPEFSAEL